VNEFFASVKADLTDRRLLPIVAVVCALLVAALAYALLGGGSSASTPTVPPVPSVTGSKGIAVTSVTTQKAVAETTDGSTEQTHGVARDPFAALPGSETTTPATAGTPSTSSSSIAPSAPSSSGSEPSGSSGGSTSNETPGSSNSEQTKPKSKPKTVYDVTIKFGTLPPGITAETANLHEYKKLKLQTPLPSAKQGLIVFRGVTSKGKSATFTIVSEAIPTGAGSCLPSAVQCEVVDLKPGETEQFDVQQNGQPVLYELRVLSIDAEKATTASSKASAASSHRRGTGQWGVSRVGQELLRKAGLVALPFLRYSSQPGVLVFAKPKAKKPHAHGARASQR
jgi:hypothetical protein